MTLATLLCGMTGLIETMPVLAAECPSTQSPTDQRLTDQQPPAQELGETAADAPTASRNIQIQSSQAEVDRDGNVELSGEVEISQGDHQLRTEAASYDAETQRIRVPGNLEYTDPNLTLRGESGDIGQDSGASFTGASFELKDRQARGQAKRLRVDRDADLTLEGVRYTTCPIGSEDWVLSASDININQRLGLGTGRNVRLDFKGVPILYTPIISFPVGNERKSGFLFPSFGNSSRNGTDISVPWYWNIAPNYDATFVPNYLSKRGGKLDTEFRYLTETSRGSLSGEALPNDQQFGRSRSYFRFEDKSDFTADLRLTTEAANVSDNEWFEDFGLGPEGTSVLFLNRSIDLSYISADWNVSARAQNFQTVDETIASQDRPYTVLPQIHLQGTVPNLPLGSAFEIDGEVTNFRRNDGVTGLRFDSAPQIRLPLRARGVYIEPAASWRFTSYQLQDLAADGNDSPSRSAPLFTVDTGLKLERDSGSKRQRIQTLEPRLMYLYVPFRNQDDLPVFDTTLADLNLIQLFRTNRYIGGDRLSDANQISVGVTSRLLDAESGQQFLTATIGQTYFIEEPRVRLPGETRNGQNSSDIITELGLAAFRNWNVGIGAQWDTSASRFEKGDLNIQYAPANDRVFNLGYRFRRDSVEQIDTSLALPISRSWNGYTRFVYSFQDNKTLEYFGGVEYRSCCYRLRLVARNYVRNRSGDTDSSILLQLELNGLSNVGVGADRFLEQSIRGYSATPSTR